MSKPIPTIQTYMTPSPHSIGENQTLHKAHEMMHEHHIRHLPVLAGSVLVGILTDRDLHLVESLKEVDPRKVTVEEAMTSSVYQVTPETPLDEVVRTMGEHKYGCAVVIHTGRVVGIFTTVDLCRAFSDLLHSKFAK